MALSVVEVLCCRIIIGDADPSNPMAISNPVTLTEVKEIEINESYKNLIGTAKVVLPKGTVFKSTIIGSTTLEGKDASMITTEVMEDGVIIEKRSSQSAVNATTFKVGQRISISLGYNGVLKKMFEGYITAYNSDNLFELTCENMANKLKLKQAPKFETPVIGTRVNDVLGEKYNLLKDTGFAIHSDTKRFDIENGIRYHIATAGALLNESIMQPRLDYKTLLHLVGYLTQDPKQVDEMFRRMVFNVLTDNKDDHAKNFSFIYKEGNWALAPAYDLTRCNNGYNGEHATSVNNHGNPTIEDMLIVGESIRIPRKKGKEMILTIAEGCAELLSKKGI